jgi:hypothetical protein
MATPVVALGVDGAWYDAAALEAAWGVRPVIESSDFYTRVIAARCLGLFELDARLHGGPRPAGARLQTADMLLLPPCDTDRCAFFRFADYAAQDREEPRFERADPRTLVGHGQPVPLPHASPDPVSLQAGLAVVLREELWRATPREALDAVAGVTLELRWGSAHAPSSLGPALVMGRSLRDMAALELKVSSGAHTVSGPIGGWRFQPAEMLAFASQLTPLRPGDVVGLGGALPSPLPVPHGQRVEATLAPVLRLQAWPTQGPPPVRWRL